MRAPHAAIATEESGTPGAPLVVLVHGSMDRMTGMAKLARRLATTCHVIRYDRRGYGRSAPHPGPFGIDDHVADLAAIVSGRRCTLVGHSYGGNVVLAFAERHPNLAAALAVYEVPLSWQPSWPGTTAGAVATSRDPASAAEGFMRRMIGDARWERLPERTRAARRAEGPALVGELLDLRARPPWTPERITCPVVAGWGELGQPHHRQGTAWLASAVRDGRPVELHGCRHGAHSADPDQFAERLVQPALAAASAAP